MPRFAGERLVDGTCPLVAKETIGDPDRPAVVFLPGALHTARIAYGLPHDRPEDFLAHWVAATGRTFIGVSYPIAVGDPLFDRVDPTLRLDQLTAAVADEVAATLARHGGRAQVVVAAWSALGNAAPLLRADLAARGVELGTFVGLAATPPLPNLVLGSLETSAATVGGTDHYRDSGLLRHDALRSESFLAELDRIDGELGRTVIDRQRYRDHHLGDMPLEIFPGLEAHRTPAGPAIDNGPSLAASGGARWADYPICASVAPTLPSDRRHVITDRHNWAMVTTNAVQWRLLAGLGPEPDPGRWPDIVATVHRLGTDLHRVVPGGHLFFVGEPGARATATAIDELDDERARLEATLADLVAGN